MRKALRRGGWTWLVAGTFGLAAQAGAQPSLHPTTPASAPRAWSGAPDAAGPATAETFDAAETRVKLAWLANPATFRHLLAVAPRGNSLEVRGFVPSEEVRRLALRLACEAGRMPVLDALQVQPKMPSRPIERRSPPAIAKAALAILREAFGDQVRRFTVSVQPDGQVTVLGQIDSDAERLAVSQRLCRLEGCTSINNQLRLVEPATARPAVTVAKQGHEEPRPLPRSVLQATAPAVPQLAAAPARESRTSRPARFVIPASIETSAPSQTAQGVPAKPTTILPATSTPGIPQIVKGPQHGLALPADQRQGPQICQASPPSQDPSPAIISHAGGPATLLGPPAPQIISSPPRPPVILPGAGWPLRSILEVPDKPEGKAQVKAGSASAVAPTYGFQAVARPEALPHASVTHPPVPVLPSAGPVATLQKPASVPLPPVHIEMPAMKPGLPYETIGVMTFGDDYPAPAPSSRPR